MVLAATDWPPATHLKGHTPKEVGLAHTWLFVDSLTIDSPVQFSVDVTHPPATVFFFFLPQHSGWVR